MRITVCDRSLVLFGRALHPVVGCEFCPLGAADLQAVMPSRVENEQTLWVRAEGFTLLAVGAGSNVRHHCPTAMQLFRALGEGRTHGHREPSDEHGRCTKPT